MRVIIAGETGDGQTIKVSERDVGDLGHVTTSFGAAFADVYCSDSVVRLPSAAASARCPNLFPAAGGFRFWIFTIPAHCAPLEPGEATDAELAAIRALDPERAARLAAIPGGFASADTVEWIVVLSGEVEYLLPDGQCFSLKQGDSIVQIGAMHRWRNVRDQVCVMAASAIGASRWSAPAQGIASCIEA